MKVFAFVTGCLVLVAAAAGIAVAVELSHSQSSSPTYLALDTGGYPWAAASCSDQSWTGTFADGQQGVACEGDNWEVDGAIYNPSTSYGYRNCTDYVAWKVHQVEGVTLPKGMGDARDWGGYFAGRGNPPTGTPSVGAIAWEVGGDHVAFVEAVNGNAVTVAEYNEHYRPGFPTWGSGTFDTRSVPTTSFEYIHVGTTPLPRAPLPGIPIANASPATGAQSSLAIRPATIEFGADELAMYAGGGGPTSWPYRPTFRPIRWSSWTTVGAQGTGVWWMNNCLPDCASGAFTSEPIRLRAWAPDGGFFARLTVTAPNGSFTLGVIDHGGYYNYQWLTSEPPWAGATIDLMDPPRGEFFECAGNPFVSVYYPYGITVMQGCSIAVGADAAKAIGCAPPTSPDSYPSETAFRSRFSNYSISSDGAFVNDQRGIFFFVAVQCS
jgi:surface antigen